MSSEEDKVQEIHVSEEAWQILANAGCIEPTEALRRAAERHVADRDNGGRGYELD